MRINYAEFCATGRFGDIQLGSPLQMVRELLGEPQDVSIDRKLWKYGSLQIGFYQYVVTYIGIYLYHDEALPENIDVEAYAPTQQTTYQDFIAFLENNAISYAIVDLLTDNNQIGIETSAKVHILFDAQGSQMIDSLQYSGMSAIRKK